MDHTPTTQPMTIRGPDAAETSSRSSRHRARDRGASLVEYAMLVALIAVACLTGLSVFSGSNSGSLDDSSSRVASAVGFP